MYTNPVIFIRLLLNNRRVWVPCMILVGLCAVTAVVYQPDQHRRDGLTTFLPELDRSFPYSIPNTFTYDQVKSLLDQLLDLSTSLVDVQLIWNQLMEVWRRILDKFVHDACESCHRSQPYCFDSIDIARYIYHINESFYPSNEVKRPLGMGLYYYFDLKTLRSVNNSILPTDVSHCDYFHMLQLMINVQTVLHQAQIKYFLTKGTLIGALRHHDVIPWDTDIDLFIPASATSRILKSFRQLDLSVKQASPSTTDSTSSTTRATKE